jgi:hypothetical protein
MLADELSEMHSYQTTIQQNQIGSLISKNETDKFTSLNVNDQKGNIFDRQNSEKVANHYMTPQRDGFRSQPEREKDVQSASAPQRYFKSRQGLRPVQARLIQNHNQKRLSENPSSSLLDEQIIGKVPSEPIHFGLDYNHRVRTEPDKF